MREIGVRELKAGLSGVLREVEDGEPVRVTVRGRPIADIVPTSPGRQEAKLRELVSSGKLTPASRSRPPRAPRPVAVKRTASSIVLEERDSER